MRKIDSRLQRCTNRHSSPSDFKGGFILSDSGGLAMNVMNTPVALNGSCHETSSFLPGSQIFIGPTLNRERQEAGLHTTMTA